MLKDRNIVAVLEVQMHKYILIIQIEKNTLITLFSIKTLLTPG